MSDEISLETFKLFYNENKDKLFIPEEKIGSRGFNEENVKNWFSKITEFSPEYENDKSEDRVKVKEPYLFFAKTLIEIFKYIDFTTFLERVEIIAKELITKIQDNPTYEYIYFLIPEEINKSNTWVTLLFAHYMYDAIIDNDIFNSKIRITTNILNVAEKCFNNGNPIHVLCIYCDDMSYTGSQLYSNIRLRKNYFNGETAFLENMSVFIAIPYLTPLVTTKLKDVKYVEYSENSIFINRYIDELSIKYGETNPTEVKDVIDIMVNLKQKHKLSNDACMGSVGYTAIYFDHKVADELSTFKKVLFTGAYPVKDQTDCSKNPLILGCDSEVIDYKCNSALYIDYELECYPSFYKKIKFKINNRQIKSSKSIILLKSLYYTKGGASRKNKHRSLHYTKKK